MATGGRQLMEMETRALSMVLADVCVESTDLMASLSSSDSDWDDHLLSLESQASDLAFIIGYKEGEDTDVTADRIKSLEQFDDNDAYLSQEESRQCSLRERSGGISEFLGDVQGAHDRLAVGSRSPRQ